MLKYLIEKEFKQIFRNAFIPKILIGLPLMAMLVFPWAASQEVTKINVTVVDNDHSVYSKRMVDKIAASSYFVLAEISTSNEEALQTMESGKADIILEIQSGFEKDLIREGKAPVMISANAVNGMKGGLGAAYLGGIIQDYAAQLRNERIQSAGNQLIPVISIVSQNRFNVFLDYKIYMVPALMVMLLTLICGFLPTFNIVSEKEKGTIEQINVTPVNKFVFIISKMIPYWAIGFCILSLAFSLAAITYGLIPAGNWATIYLIAMIYILVVSGMGMVISNYSSTMQQGMFVMFFFIIIMVIMSGLFTPITSMPEWAQYIAAFNPLKYFIQVMRMIVLKGSGISHLGTQILTLVSFALFFNIWAVLSYRKSS